MKLKFPNFGFISVFEVIPSSSGRREQLKGDGLRLGVTCCLKCSTFVLAYPNCAALYLDLVTGTFDH